MFNIDLIQPLFAYALTLDGYQIAMGIIISTVLGFSAGNYACSLVHRLPRGLGVLDKKPYCGTCETPLATKDLFPVFSALLLNHKCRYCGAVIPKTHFYTELALGTLFCLCFTKFGFSEQYALMILIGSMLTVLASIHHNDQQVDRRVLITLMLTGLLYRTLVDHSIYPALESALFIAVVSAFIWRKQIEKRAHIYVLPEHAAVLVAGAMCVGTYGVPLFVASYLVIWLVMKLIAKQVRYTMPFSLALVLTLFIAV